MELAGASDPPDTGKRPRFQNPMGSREKSRQFSALVGIQAGKGVVSALEKKARQAGHAYIHALHPERRHENKQR